MRTADDAVEAGARALTESEYGEGPNDLQMAGLVVTAAWPILSDGLRELHRANRPVEDGAWQGYTGWGYGYLDTWCVECSEQSGREYGTVWPCATVRELDRIDKELGL